MATPPDFSSPLDPVNFPIRRCPVKREKAETRICIMRLGAAGDIIMSTPLLTALRKAYPNGHFTWMVEHNHRSVIEAHPFVDEVIAWDGGLWRHWWREKIIQRVPRLALYAARFAWEMRQRKFDVFLNFHGEQWPLMVRVIGAPLSVGVFDTFPEFDAERHEFTRFYNVAYTRRDLPPHRTDQHLLALNPLGLPQPPPEEKQTVMGFTAEDEAAVADFLCERGVEKNAPYVVIAPVTTWPSRCWPLDRYAALADNLIRNNKVPVVLIGSAGEKEAVQSVAAQMHETAVDAGGGQLTFRQVAALIANSRLLCSGDTGPMHVAGAVNTPFVALFGPTPVEKLAPLRGRGTVLMHPVPCGPCDVMHCSNAEPDFMRCMRLITLEEADAACTQALKQKSPHPPAPSPATGEGEFVKHTDSV